MRLAWVVLVGAVACGGGERSPDARVPAPAIDAGGAIDAGRPGRVDAGTDRGAHRVHCHCGDGRIEDRCAPRDCSSDDLLARCAEVCGDVGALEATCLLDDPACVGIPHAGAWRVDCTCPDGSLKSYCGDASCQDVGAPGCRDLCGEGPDATCELGGCALPSGPDALKCRCVDGVEVSSCVAGIDCDSITEVDSHCEWLCVESGGFAGAACERGATECAVVAATTLMRCTCVDGTVAQGCTTVVCGDAMAELAACSDLCLAAGGATGAYCYADWPACP